MEVINNVDVKPITMIKLGPKYYPLRDGDAVRKSQLWKPETAVTGEMLKAYYAPSFYETLSAAVTAVNAGAVGEDAAAEQENTAEGEAAEQENTAEGEAAEQENVAVYTDENGAVHIVLLTDVAESVSVTVTADAIVQLNGCVLSFSESGTHLNFADTVVNAVIDGRVPGSKIVKTVEQATTVTERILNLSAENCSILGGEYELNLSNSSAACLAVKVENTRLYGENCTIQVTQSAGSGNLYGIMAYSPMSLQGCTVKCQGAGGVVRCVEVKPDAGEAYFSDCSIFAESMGSSAVGLYPRCGKAVVRNCRIEANQAENDAEYLQGKATAIQQYADDLTVENCHLSASSGITHSNCIYAYQGEYRIKNTKIYAVSTENYSYALENLEAARGYLEDCTFFADAASGEMGNANGTGVYNTGRLTMVNCNAWGTHSGMQLLPGSHTYVTGGKFEGVGHGGIYFANKNGSAYIQDARILNVRYSGKLKNRFDYQNQYYTAALYMGKASTADVDNTAVYLDNCLIDGGTGNAMVLRGTDGEHDNAIYMSNCEVTGGTIRIDSDTHKLYVGKACHIEPESTKPECIVQTDAVYTNAAAMPEDMPEGLQ